MPDPKDFLPPPPWEGPPIPRILSREQSHVVKPFWHPRFWQVGPTEDSPTEVWAIWDRAVEAAIQKYPIGHPILVAESKRAGTSQEEMLALIAHDDYIQKLRQLGEKYLREEAKEEEEEEEEEE